MIKVIGEGSRRGLRALPSHFCFLEDNRDSIRTHKSLEYLKEGP